MIRRKDFIKTIAYISGQNAFHIDVKCPSCKREKRLKVSAAGFEKYRSGRYNVQDCFPELDTSKRELLISGICPDCWNEMFSEV